MNKTELVKAIAEKVEISAKDVAAVVDAYAVVIADALKSGVLKFGKAYKEIFN